MKKFVFWILILAVLFLAVACGNEAVTTAPETTADAVTTNLPKESTAVVTEAPPTTTTAEITEATDTTPDTKWMAKIEPNFFEKAIEEDGKYYIYMTYQLVGDSDDLYCNQQFVDAFVPDHNDIVFANLDRGMASNGIYLRATAEEIETYAQNDYVLGIYSYPADKVVEGCKANIVRLDALFNPYALWEFSEENVGGSLPMVKIDSKEELATCIDACVPTQDEIYNTRYEMNRIAERYDDAFFSDKTIFFMGAEANTGSSSFTFVHAFADETFTIVIDKSTPFMITNDMAQWAILVEVDNSAIANQTAFSVVVE